jgi:hypothetical protein
MLHCKVERQTGTRVRQGNLRTSDPIDGNHTTAASIKHPSLLDDSNNAAGCSHGSRMSCCCQKRFCALDCSLRSPDHHKTNRHDGDFQNNTVVFLCVTIGWNRAQAQFAMNRIKSFTRMG